MNSVVVHWELRETMKELDVELVIGKAIERHPSFSPPIVSDTRPKFIARDFNEFVRVHGLTHVSTSPYYPHSNGRMERWYGALRAECIRPSCPATLDEARKRIEKYVNHYNHVRLHNAIGYITPTDCLAGLIQMIGEERDRKLKSASERRQLRRTAAKQQVA